MTRCDGSFEVMGFPQESAISASVQKPLKAASCLKPAEPSPPSAEALEKLLTPIPFYPRVLPLWSDVSVEPAAPLRAVPAPGLGL